MDEHTRAQLTELNRRFYDQFAGQFTESRRPAEPGLEIALSQVKPLSRVLDLGCGQGRVRTMLPETCEYIGVDFSSQMLEQAAKRTATSGKTHYIEADLSSPEWAQAISGSFECIVLRAVLHHIPGWQDRLQLVRQARLLLSGEGKLILANWQFLESPRLRARILPWSTVGVDQNTVDRGDYLLDWQRGGNGVRYVHLIDENETRSLAAESGLIIERLYRCDGHQNRLTLYAILSAG